MHALQLMKRRRSVSLSKPWNHSRGPHVTRTLRKVLAATNAPSSASREPTRALAAASAPLRSATSLATTSQGCPASATVAVTGAPSFASAAVAVSVSRGISAREARRGPHRHLVTGATLGKASRAGLSQTDEPSHLSTFVHRRRRRRRRRHRRRLAAARMLVPYQGCLRPTAVQHLPAARGRRWLHSIRGSSLAA